jgi:hypothetical protein
VICASVTCWPGVWAVLQPAPNMTADTMTARIKIVEEIIREWYLMVLFPPAARIRQFAETVNQVTRVDCFFPFF